MFYYKCGLKTTTNGYFEVLSTVEVWTAQCVNSSSMQLLILVASVGEGRSYIRTVLSCRDVFVTLFVCLFLAQQPPVVHRLIIHEVSRSHTTTHHSRQDSSGRVISPSQRPLPDNTQHNRYPRPRWDSKPPNSASEQQQTYALDRAATGTGVRYRYQK